MLQLVCGHTAHPLERHRPGTEKWCDACQRWEDVTANTHTDPRPLDDWRTAARFGASR